MNKLEIIIVALICVSCFAAGSFATTRDYCMQRLSIEDSLK